MSSKSKITISSDLIDLFQGGGLRKAAAVAIATAVQEEFDTMVQEAPQFSGNYVANMNLGTSGVARASAKKYFPENPKLGAMYQKGQMAPISFALSATAGFVEKATAHIMGKGGFLRELVVYNPLDYAAIVEGYDASSLRKENAGAEHAVAKMGDRLSRRFIPLNLKKVR